MQTINISNLRKDLYNTVDNAICFDPVRINTKKGNAILMSEEEYQSWQETLYLCSIPQMKESLLAGKDTDLKDCIAEEDFQW